MISSAYAATPDAPGGAFPPFDSSTFVGQLFWLVIFFGALYWLMSKVALPRVASILEERKDRVARDLADAAAAKTKAEGAMTAYEKSLADARGKAQGIAQATRDRVNAASDVKRKSLEADLGAKLAAAEKTVAETKAKALGNVESIATDAAGAIVERLIGKAPAPGAVADAVRAAVKG